MAGQEAVLLYIDALHGPQTNQGPGHVTEAGFNQLKWPSEQKTLDLNYRVSLVPCLLWVAFPLPRADFTVCNQQRPVWLNQLGLPGLLGEGQWNSWELQGRAAKFDPLTRAKSQWGKRKQVAAKSTQDLFRTGRASWLHSVKPSLVLTTEQLQLSGGEKT